MSKDPSHRWAIDTSPEVRLRNRYQNVQAWANSRIRLKVPEGECDFINASPIVLKDSRTGDETRYIATQVWFFLGHQAVGVVMPDWYGYRAQKSVFTWRIFGIWCSTKVRMLRSSLC
jgi:hypothetical protein